MPTLQQSIIALNTTLADLPAAPGGSAIATAWGAPDAADFAAILMPFSGTIVGIAVTGSPAAGDTIAILPQISSNKNGGGAGGSCASLAVQLTNAAPAASAVVSKDQADCQFSAGQFLNLFYTTTTGGTYTPRDINVTLFISTGRTDL